MSPLWPDFAIARAARATAEKQGLIDQTEKARTQPRAARERRWLGDLQRDIVRRPIRRSATSNAL